MSTVLEAALDKTRTRVSQRRLRLEDFFSDFDRLNSGRITREQFRRVLTTNGVALTDEELQGLVDAFNIVAVAPTTGASTRTSSVPRKDGLVEVNYHAFLRALRSDMAPRASMAAMSRTVAAMPITQEEEDRLAPVMKMLTHAVRAQRMNVAPAFRDMDPLNTGKVTAAQFQRCLPFSSLDVGVLGLLTKKYGDGEGNVYYMMWCRDVDPTLSEPGATAAGGAAAVGGGRPTCGSVVSGAMSDSKSTLFFTGSYRNPDLTVDELIRVLREQFALYRLRSEDYFADFDKFTTGTVSPAQFESALGRLNFVKFALTEENINVLIEAYTVQPVEPGDPVPDVHHVRVNYKTFLYDTNPKNFPVVSAAGVESANYFNSTHAADAFMQESAELEAANRILEKVARLVRANRIFLSPVFRDFDRVRKMIYEHRTCTAARFARGLATQNLILPADELKLLIRKYTVPHADGSASNEVNYYQFVLDVDPSQAAGAAEANEAAAAQKLAAAVGRGIVSQLQSTNGQNNPRLRAATELDAVLQKIADRAEERTLRVTEFFIDFDPLRSGSLLREHIVTALGIAGLDLQGSELELLANAYMMGGAAGGVSGPRPKQGMIDTRAFMRDLGAYAPQAIPSTTLATSLAMGQSNVAATTLNNAVATSKEATATTAASAQLSEEDSRILALLLQRLEHEVRTRGALLSPFFADFDKFNNGKITRTNFMQAVTRHRFVLSADESDLLCKYYAAAQDPEQVEYRRFIREVGHEEYPLAASAAAAMDGVITRAAGASVGSSQKAQNTYTEADVQEVLDKICYFMEERNPRVREFFPDGDELRHQHVTNTRFRHAVSILGITLTEQELCALEQGFAKEMMPGEVDYPAFVATVRGMLKEGVGRFAVTQRRMGTANAPQHGQQEERIFIDTIRKIKRALASRRTTSLPSFREYDKARRGAVKEGQFFACLMSLGVQLAPDESASMTKAYSIGNGEMGYVRFAQEVDEAVFSAVS